VVELDRVVTGRSADQAMSSTPQSVGYVGLGHLGRHLAASLVRAGHTVTVHDLDPISAAELLQAGALWADSPRDVAAASHVVFTCLPSPAAVNAVVDGRDGVLSGLRPGDTWIDNSTNDQAEVIRLSALAHELGIQMLEAPVTGGVHKAAAGEITVLVGGDPAVFQQHRQLLAALGDPVLYMGPMGSAALIKVITNMLAFIHLVAAGEALMLAKQGGLDLATTFEAIANSSGTSFVHETESQVILNGSYDIGFTMDLACKDLEFAVQFGRELGVPLELADMVQQTFLRARTAYGGGAWSSQVVKLLEDAVGVDLRAPGFPATLQ
jgi:3-hydroxyisobutyrate dehydrogenase